MDFFYFIIIIICKKKILWVLFYYSHSLTLFFVFFRDFQPMMFASNDSSLSSGQDTN